MNGTDAKPSNWWMFHADPNHSGVATGSSITSETVADLQVFKDIELDGPILSTPAVVDGFIYVGTANNQKAAAQNGGAFYKIDISTGDIAASYHWEIPGSEADTHGFCGMGTTPAVCNGRIYFSAFNGKFYCLDQDDLSEIWITDLRYGDPGQNQPVNNTLSLNPPVAGWSSPLVVGDRIYVGMGEGENFQAYGIAYCLDAESGKVVWLFCTARFEDGVDNEPNVVPADVAISPLPPGFAKGPVVGIRGCSIWAGIAYDHELNRLYCSTGNPAPDGALPTPGYSNGILSLDAETGEFRGFQQFPAESSYRPSDIDVDVGGAPTVFTDGKGRRVVGLGCKNGTYMILEADTLEILCHRQMLPKTNAGEQIPTVDPHVPPSQQNEVNVQVSNAVSNNTPAENYFGTYSTAAVDAAGGRLFMGVGGNNYHPSAPGIDTPTTPFMRAMDWVDLKDVWPLDDNDPYRYAKARPPMYTTASESGLAVPAVVNDVVFMSTTAISLYAFSTVDGTCLYSNQIGAQTGGFKGGYGYCLGPAVWGNYVVAGALVLGRDGGLLRIYKLGS